MRQGRIEGKRLYDPGSAASELRQQSGLKVFVAGCFNRIHLAHLRMLRASRALGTELVVILTNDAHNRKPTAAPAKERLAWMREAGVADQVKVGLSDSFVETLRREKPGIIALGYDQGLPDEATRKAAAELGIEVVSMPWYPGKDKILWPRS